MIKFKNTEFGKVNNIKRKYSVDFEKQLNVLLNKFKTRTEYEMNNTSYYRPINEAMLNTNKKLFCKSIALSVSQDETNKAQHLLEVSMLHPAMLTEIKRPLAMGDKQTIMEYLNNKDTLKTLNNDLIQMSDKLKSR